jgi:hypothetical protein
MSELEPLGEAEFLAAWARRALPLKDQLSIADAQVVEAAFETRLSALDDPVPALLPESKRASDPDRPPQRTEAAPKPSRLSANRYATAIAGI